MQPEYQKYVFLASAAKPRKLDADQEFFAGTLPASRHSEHAQRASNPEEAPRAKLLAVRNQLEYLSIANLECLRRQPGGPGQQLLLGHSLESQTTELGHGGLPAQAAPCFFTGLQKKLDSVRLGGHVRERADRIQGMPPISRRSVQLIVKDGRTIRDHPKSECERGNLLQFFRPGFPGPARDRVKRKLAPILFYC